MKISSREDAIEFRKLRDHIGVMLANDKLTDSEREHIRVVLRIMCHTLETNGYRANIGREPLEYDYFDDIGGWKGYI